jgi:hypothetical protein
MRSRELGPQNVRHRTKSDPVAQLDRASDSKLKVVGSIPTGVFPAVTGQSFSPKAMEVIQVGADFLAQLRPLIEQLLSDTPPLHWRPISSSSDRPNEPGGRKR